MPPDFAPNVSERELLVSRLETLRPTERKQAMQILDSVIDSLSYNEDE